MAVSEKTLSLPSVNAGPESVAARSDAAESFFENRNIMRGIRRIYLAAAAVAAMAAGAWSCAGEAPDIANGLARQSFEAWVAKYAPAAYANPYKDVYIEYIERGPENAAVPVLDYTWLTVNYTGRTLDGSVFVTRVDSISRRVGKFAYTTHYSDDFLQFTSTSTKLCDGLRQAFERMRVGDSVRVYIPFDKGYAFSMDVNSGYAGEQGVSYTQLPIVFEMRLKAVTTQPFIWERDSVQRYAEQRWANSDYSHDTVGMYMRIVKHNPAGDPITKDSTAFVYYEAYFMDGFLAATNIDTVARKWNVYNSGDESAYESLSILPSSGENVMVNKVLYIAAPLMRKGEVAEVVTVSTWAHGDAGDVSSTPEILPYQPMRYKIHIVDDDRPASDTE